MHLMFHLTILQHALLHNTQYGTVNVILNEREWELLRKEPFFVFTFAVNVIYL